VSWFRQIGGVAAGVSVQGPVRDLDGAYERWFAEHECEAFLARPDFYVFAAGAHTDIPRFVSRLRQVLHAANTEGK
jgi:resorcinol 4-hydroxylase (NADPH)